MEKRLRIRFVSSAFLLFAVLLPAAQPAPKVAPDDAADVASILPAGSAQAPSTNRIARYATFEVRLESEAKYNNPFMDVTVTVHFTAPSGRTLTAQSFHDGGDTWRVRIAPDETGTWSYRTTCSDAANRGLHQQAGSFTCLASRNQGFIRVDPKAKYYFSRDGSQFFGLGDTCYGLVSGISDAQRRGYLDTRAGQGFNFVRFFAAGYPFIETKNKKHEALRVWPWGGTPTAPDYDRLNPEFFRRLDGIFAELAARRMYAEVLVFNYYSKPFTDPAVWTPRRQDLWLRYLVARLAANPAVFLWTVTNEYETYPDGSYRNLAGAPESDHAWAIRIAAAIHGADPYHHPVTVHPTEAAIDQNYLPGERGEIGRRFGAAPEIDVLTHQVNTYLTAKWHEAPAPGFWDGPATGVSGAIKKDRHYNKPVINTENGYEWLKGWPTSYYKQLHSTDKCRRAAWRTLVAGGAAYAAGFAGTWPGRDGWMWRNKEGPLPFTVADMGLAKQLGFLSEFVASKINLLRAAPAPELVNTPNLCLAEPGQIYIVYLPEGGELTLDLRQAPGAFDARWFNPRNGEWGKPFAVAGEGRAGLQAPDPQDWALHLRARSKQSSGG